MPSPLWDLDPSGTLRDLLCEARVPCRVREASPGHVTVTVPAERVDHARMLVEAWGFGSVASVDPASVDTYRSEPVVWDA